MPASISKASFLGFRAKKNNVDDITLESGFADMLDKKVRVESRRTMGVEIKRAKRRKKKKARRGGGHPADIALEDVTLEANFAKMLEERVRGMELEERVKEIEIEHLVQTKERADRRMDRELIDTEIAARTLARDGEEDPHGIFCCLPCDAVFRRLDRMLDATLADGDDRTAADSWDSPGRAANRGGRGGLGPDGADQSTISSLYASDRWDSAKQSTISSLHASDRWDAANHARDGGGADLSGGPGSSDRECLGEAIHCAAAAGRDIVTKAKDSGEAYLFGGLDEVDGRAASDGWDAPKSGRNNLVMKGASRRLGRTEGASERPRRIDCCPDAVSKPGEVGARVIPSSTPTSTHNASEPKPEEAGAPTVASQPPPSTQKSGPDPGLSGGLPLDILFGGLDEMINRTAAASFDIAKNVNDRGTELIFGGLDEVDEVDDREVAGSWDKAKNGKNNLVKKDVSERLRGMEGVPESLQGIDCRVNALELKPEEVGAQTTLSSPPASAYDTSEMLQLMDRRLKALELKPEEVGVQTILSSPPTLSYDEPQQGIDRNLKALELKPEEVGVQTSPLTLSYDESLQEIDRRLEALELKPDEVGVQTILSSPTSTYDVSESLQRMDWRLNALELSISEDAGSPDPGHSRGPVARSGLPGNGQAGADEIAPENDRAGAKPTPEGVEKGASSAPEPGPTPEKVAANDWTIEPMPGEECGQEVTYHPPISVQTSATAEDARIEPTADEVEAGQLCTPSPSLKIDGSWEASDVIYHEEADVTCREPVPIRTINIASPRSKLCPEVLPNPRSLSKPPTHAGETKKKSFGWFKSRRDVARKESTKANAMRLDVRPGRRGAAACTKRGTHRNAENCFASATPVSTEGAPTQFAGFPFPEGTHPLEA